MTCNINQETNHTEPVTEGSNISPVMSLTAQLHGSAETTPMVPWQLDWEEYDSELDMDSRKTTLRKQQPWRLFWPPTSQKILNIWRQSEHPEVLSWRFDRTQPFDRPWRTWTKSFFAQMEEGAIMISSEIMANMQNWQEGMLNLLSFLV